MHRLMATFVVALACLLAPAAEAHQEHRELIGTRSVPVVRAGNGVPVRVMLARALSWDRAKAPYHYSGGHGTLARPGQPVDCSGFVSGVVLPRHAIPMTSGQFMGWGKPGRGRHVTVLANGGHVLMAIRQRHRWRWFATSYSNPGGGAGEIAQPSGSYRSAYVARHPG